jgi:hypothetical protein
LNDESAKPMAGIAHGWLDFAALEAIIWRYFAARSARAEE